MRNASATLPGTAIVAGGAGFVGSHLCEMLLRYGGTVICVDRFISGELTNIEHLTGHPRFHLEVHDICQPWAPDLRPDRIYNLACAATAQHYREDPIHTMMTSVLGTHNLLDLAKTSGARFLQASTSNVSPLQASRISGSADYKFDPTDPRACYEQGARAAETLCADARKLHRVDARIARIFPTYGPRMVPDPEDPIVRFVSAALEGEDICLPGDGTAQRSACHIADLVPALLLLMERPVAPLDPIDLGNPEMVSLRVIAEKIIEISGGPSRILTGAPAVALEARWPDIRPAGNLLGWAPLTPIGAGLADLLDHFRSARNVIDHPRRAAGILRSQRRRPAPGGADL